MQTRQTIDDIRLGNLLSFERTAYRLLAEAEEADLQACEFHHPEDRARYQAAAYAARQAAQKLWALVASDANIKLPATSDEIPF